MSKTPSRKTNAVDHRHSASCGCGTHDKHASEVAGKAADPGAVRPSESHDHEHDRDPQDTSGCCGGHDRDRAPRDAAGCCGGHKAQK